MHQPWQNLSTFVNLWQDGGMATATLLPISALLDQCCARDAAQPLPGDVAAGIARKFKALGEPARVQLLALIAAADDDGACVCDLTEPMGLSQPTVSHHLKRLTDAGLVTRQQRGKWAYYRLVDDEIGALGQAVAQIVRPT
jgi:ArsR family transcriptional regulator